MPVARRIPTDVVPEEKQLDAAVIRTSVTPVLRESSNAIAKLN